MNKPKIIACHPILFNRLTSKTDIQFDITAATKEKTWSINLLNKELSLTSTSYTSLLPEVHHNFIKELKEIQSNPKRYIFKDNYWNKTFFVPLSLNIVRLYVENDFDVSIVSPANYTKFHHYVEKCNKIFDLKGHITPTESAKENRDLLLNIFFAWDSYYPVIDELVKTFKLKYVELHTMEGLFDYFDKDNQILYTTPIKRMVSRSLPDFYQDKEDSFPDNDNIIEWAEWFNKVLLQVPEEYRHTAEWEEQNGEVVYVTWQEPETEEERTQRIKEYQKSMDNYKLNFHTMQDFIQITFDF